MMRDRGRLAMAPEAATSSNHGQGTGTEVPAVVFDRVSLAFDDNVVLREISFSVYFEGDAAEFRASPDPYLRTFLSGWVPPLV